MHPKTAARQMALRALVRSESNDLVAPDFRDLDSGVRPFARELYSGTQRQRARLDWTIAPLLSKPIAKIDAPVRAALRLAAYEKLVLQTPPYGFVGEYAGLMREENKTSAVGFVNAIARRLPDHWRSLPADLPQKLAIEFSHPQWLVQRYLKNLGAPATEELLRANNSRAELCLRANTLEVSRDELLARIPNARAGALSPDAIRVEGGGDPTRLPGWDDGDFFVQDEAAQLVAHYAAATAGQSVLDLAGAPGGKATHCAQLMKNQGKIVSVDIAPGRLKLVRENAARLGISILQVRTADVRHFESDLADVVLLDAPCLGTGTLRRRPDAKWRKTPQALAELVELQRELLDAAAQLVAPGGALIYSTCSLEPEENSAQARAFTERSGWPSEAAPAWMRDIQTDEGWLQSWPHRHAMDGMFAAKWRKPQ